MPTMCLMGVVNFAGIEGTYLEKEEITLLSLSLSFSLSLHLNFSMPYGGHCFKYI